MIDAKLYKACTGMDTPASVRVCKYCHRVTLRSEVAAATEHSLNQSTSPDRSVRSTSQQQQPQHFKNEASSSGSVKNSWFFNSTIGRRLSTSTSLASLGEMVRSTITPERKPSLTRPVSASSDHDRRLSLVNMTCDGPAPYDLISSSSYNNLRSLISEVHERIDYGCNKPNWVKEILEDAEQKQLEQLEQEQLENDIEFVKEFDKNDNHEYAFSDEEDEDLNDEQPDASTLVKFNSNAETISVRYSLTPTRPRDDCSAGKKLRPPPIDLNVQSLENSTGSTSESSSPYDLFRNMIPGEQSFFDDLEINAAPRLDMSSDSGTSPVPEDIALSLMSAIYDKHCNRILQQTLVDEKLSLDWLPVIADLSKRIASTIVLNHHSYLSSIDNYYMDSFDTRQGLRRHTVTTIKCGNTYFPMDIRQRVKIKCIQNGSKAECAIFNGVVFTKNVAHRRMRTDINNPKILLFACSIGYDERKRALATTTSTSAILKLTSFDSMRLQEPNYVANLVAKIASMEPQVIFVMGSVSSSALELLHEKYGITVVLNVKRQILERIALFTGTHLIYSPEILNQTRIGTCGRFRLQKFAVSKEVDYGTGQKCAPMTKTLMFVESCPEEAGCSVLLRGTARFAEFRQLKSVLGYMIYVQYNARLEKAFHLSLNCLPIEPNAHWKSMGEMLQYISRTRQRMSSARSRSIFQEEPHSVVSDISTHETELVAVKQPKTVTKLTAISDNSDPLRSSQNDPATNDVSPLSRSPKLNTVELTEIISTKFDQLLSAVPLSSSPGIEFPAPFLMEPNIHSKSSLRHYYPPNLLVSERLSQLTSLEIDKRASNSSEIYRNGNESFEKDDDYTNFVYLSEHYGQIKRDFPALADAVSRKEEAKLRPVEKLLESRYMVQKPHPLLLANEHARAFQNGRQLVSDFRSCGPYLRCIPTISLKTSKNGKAAANLPSEPAVEPLSSIDQERITVLFSVFSPQSKNAPNYCFKPHTLDIAYYGKNDMSLGAFLFRHFFFLRSRYNQPSGNLASDDSAYGSHLNTNLGSSVARRIFCSSETCSASMFRHLVRFSHHRGTITVLLNKIHDSRNIAMPHRILTWTFCVRCRAKSANSEMTPDALAFSFGKFLELKFYGDRHFNYNKYFDCASPCQHSLHKESYQFFSYDQLVVSFKYDPIVLYEVVTPAPIIATTRNQFSRQDLINYLQDLTVRGHEVYAKIGEELERIREVINVKVIGSQPNSQALNGVLSVLNLEAADLALIDDWASKLSTEESEFIAAIKEAHIRISTPELESTTTVVDHFRVQNRVIRAKKSVVEAVTFWNERINDFVAARKRNPDKLITSIMNRILTSDKQQQPDQKSQGDTLSSKSVDLDKPETEVGSSVSSIRPSLTNSQENLLDPSQPASKLTNITSKVISKVTPKNMTENGEGPTTSSSSTSSFAARFLSPRSNDEPYIALTNPFESSSLTRQYQMFEHYQLPTHKDVSIIVRDKDLGSIIAYALTTPEYDRKVADIAAQHKQAHFKRMSSVEGILSSDKESVDGAVNSTSAKVSLQVQSYFFKLLLFVCSSLFFRWNNSIRQLLVRSSNKLLPLTFCSTLMSSTVILLQNFTVAFILLNSFVDFEHWFSLTATPQIEPPFVAFFPTPVLNLCQLSLLKICTFILWPIVFPGMQSVASQVLPSPRRKISVSF